MTTGHEEGVMSLALPVVFSYVFVVMDTFEKL